jgi:hypothetical protein
MSRVTDAVPRVADPGGRCDPAAGSRLAQNSVRRVHRSLIQNNRSSEDARSMSYPDETMRLARGLAEEVVRPASELLQADTDLAYVQTCYTIPAIEMLSEAEALGLLATTGDQHRRG